MAKDSSFAAKVAKATAEPKGPHCPTCGDLLNTVQVVVSEKSDVKNSWKFNQKFVQVCKCNHAEVHG